MPRLRTLDDLDVAGRTVLVRLDLNVPMQDGEVTDATRIERAAPTLKELLGKGAKVVVLSHFGRPKGKREPSMSLAPLARAARARRWAASRCAFAEDCIGEPAQRAVDALAAGRRRCCSRTCASIPARRRTTRPSPISWPRSATLYVNDAFSAAHRAHASITGLAERLPARPAG